MDAEAAALAREMKDRQEIYDCIMRYCRGIDRLDREVLLSAYHPDAIDDHGSTYVGGVEGFADALVATMVADFALHRLWYDLRAQSTFDEQLRLTVGELDAQLESMVGRVVRRYAQLRGGRSVVTSLTAYATLDGLFENCLVRHIAGDADRDQIAGKVGTRDQARVGHEAQGALIDTRDADGGKRLPHPPGTLDASLAQGLQTFDQCPILGIETQADDVNRNALPLDGDLDAVDEAHAGLLGR